LPVRADELHIVEVKAVVPLPVPDEAHRQVAEEAVHLAIAAVKILLREKAQTGEKILAPAAGELLATNNNQFV